MSPGRPGSPGPDAPLTALLIDAPPEMASALVAAGWQVQPAADASAALQHDAVLWVVGTEPAATALLQRGDLVQTAFDSAVVVLLPGSAGAALDIELLRRGVEAVTADGHPAALARTLHHAVERKRLERAARTAYATDLATGLPHQAQLLEHMAQLLALREREPAPMVLLVLRIETRAGVALGGGTLLAGESANVLRRKVAVRLRSRLRASDVVAAIAPDVFGVLLGRLEAQGDGQRVAAKLVQALHDPFMVTGQPCGVTAAVGLALYPDHGKDALTLLQRASAQAGSVGTVGRDGYAGATQRGPAAAANDDAAG